jgi:hypothetical protein
MPNWYLRAYDTAATILDSVELNEPLQVRDGDIVELEIDADAHIVDVRVQKSTTPRCEHHWVSTSSLKWVRCAHCGELYYVG